MEAGDGAGMGTADGAVGDGEPPLKSFRQALDGKHSPPGKIKIDVGVVKGCPAYFISDEDMEAIARPFALTLIGKFSVNRPTAPIIRKFVQRLKFMGNVRVEDHDRFNVIFRFEDERDYKRFFLRRSYQVLGIEMKVVKWSPFTAVEEELPIQPIWISFPGLRFQLFHQNTLLKIASGFGKPLGIDSATATLSKLNQARVLVEMDISITHPDQVWIGSPESGFFQKVILENFPTFCKNCRGTGHEVNKCPRGDGCVRRAVPSVSRAQGNQNKPQNFRRALATLGGQQSDVNESILENNASKVLNIETAVQNDSVLQVDLSNGNGMQNDSVMQGGLDVSTLLPAIEGEVNVSEINGKEASSLGCSENENIVELDRVEVVLPSTMVNNSENTEVVVVNAYESDSELEDQGQEGTESTPHDGNQDPPDPLEGLVGLQVVCQAKQGKKKKETPISNVKTRATAKKDGENQEDTWDLSKKKKRKESKGPKQVASDAFTNSSPTLNVKYNHLEY